MKTTRIILSALAFGLAAVGLALAGGQPVEAVALDPGSLPLGAASSLAFGGLVVTSDNMRRLYTGFKTAFQGAFAGVTPLYKRVAMTVTSTTSAEQYGWMKDLPRIREWLGDRVIQNISDADYTIKNKPWEMTIGVDRDRMEDDTYGVYSPLFAEMGRATATFPDELVFPLLAAGFETKCYDGQYFFDADHPVGGQSVSNMQAGAGNPWFLLDVSRAILPIVFQNRRAFDFVRMDAPTDEAMFMKKQAVYGVDGRMNVGYSFWQLAFGSKADLSPANYAAARGAMMGFKGDHGRPLGVTPNLLVVGPSREAAARAILLNERDAAGATNTWHNTAELLVVPWLP